MAKLEFYNEISKHHILRQMKTIPKENSQFVTELSVAWESISQFAFALDHSQLFLIWELEETYQRIR